MEMPSDKVGGCLRTPQRKGPCLLLSRLCPREDMGSQDHQSKKRMVTMGHCGSLDPGERETETERARERERQRMISKSLPAHKDNIMLYSYKLYSLGIY